MNQFLMPNSIHGHYRMSIPNVLSVGIVLIVKEFTGFFDVAGYPSLRQCCWLTAAADSMVRWEAISKEAEFADRDGFAASNDYRGA
jgi:hypothetical protein